MAKVKDSNKFTVKVFQNTLLRISACNVYLPFYFPIF